MQTIILTLHVIVCIVLIVLVLLQAGREGMGVIVVSSDLIEIINLSNRIVVMRDGQAIKTLESDELTEENVMLYAMGVNADEKA